jgi:hypothetical protein
MLRKGRTIGVTLREQSVLRTVRLGTNGSKRKVIYYTYIVKFMSLSLINEIIGQSAHKERREMYIFSEKIKKRERLED